jgi:hypothetical protein
LNVQRVRSVLKDWVSREEIDRLASEKWWVFLGEIEATENTPYQKIWTTTDRKKAIHYIDDSLILIRYLQIKGEQPGEVADDIRASLDVYDKDEIRQMVESATQSSFSKMCFRTQTLRFEGPPSLRCLTCRGRNSTRCWNTL